MQGFVMRLVLRSALVLFLACLALPARAEPALWVVKDADSTIYLFGTFHLVKPETNWRSEKIVKAFESSGELWIEASERGKQVLIQTLIIKHGLDPKHPLSTKITPETKAKLDQIATDGGMKPAAFEPMRPWLAALTITVVPLLREGYDPAKGVDKVLEAEALAANKAVQTFETPEQQIMFFANLSPETERLFLTETVEEAAMGPDMIAALLELWVQGDVETLNEATFSRMKAEAPELYEALIVKRNEDWVAKIDGLMKGAGTTFIAVGAGHLAGEHSVQALLQARGFAVEKY